MHWPKSEAASCVPTANVRSALNREIVLAIEPDCPEARIQQEWISKPSSSPLSIANARF